MEYPIISSNLVIMSPTYHKLIREGLKLSWRQYTQFGGFFPIVKLSPIYSHTFCPFRRINGPITNSEHLRICIEYSRGIQYFCSEPPLKYNWPPTFDGALKISEPEAGQIFWSRAIHSEQEVQENSCHSPFKLPRRIRTIKILTFLCTFF